MSQPILVFDSGIGGLSVLQAIQSLLPDHDYVYLFDNARLPYGELKDQQLIDGCVSLVTGLVAQVDAAMVVIACNTASTLVLSELRRHLTIPVVGVVPAIKPAALLSHSKQIGLLATPATIKRSYTRKLIDDFAKDCQVHLFGSSELVFIAEKKLAGKPIDSDYIKQFLSPVIDSNIDVLVLGCTHFPLLRAEMQSILGDKVLLLDSGSAIANRVRSLLTAESDNLVNAKNNTDKNSSNLVGYYTAKEITTQLEVNLIKLGFRALLYLPQFA